MIRVDLTQALKQLELDTSALLAGEFKRARSVTQHDTSFKAGEVVEEPAATGERGVRRPLHLEQAQEAIASGPVTQLVAAAKLFERGGPGIGEQAAGLTQCLRAVGNEAGGEPIIDGVGVMQHEGHRVVQGSAPLLVRVAVEAASAVGAPALDAVAATP